MNILYTYKDEYHIQKISEDGQIVLQFDPDCNSGFFVSDELNAIDDNLHNVCIGFTFSKDTYDFSDKNIQIVRVEDIKIPTHINVIVSTYYQNMNDFEDEYCNHSEEIVLYDPLNPDSFFSRIKDLYLMAIKTINREIQKRST